MRRALFLGDEVLVSGSDTPYSEAPRRAARPPVDGFYCGTWSYTYPDSGFTLRTALA